MCHSTGGGGGRGWGGGRFVNRPYRENRWVFETNQRGGNRRRVAGRRGGAPYVGDAVYHSAGGGGARGWGGGTHRSRPTKCDETVCHSTRPWRWALPGSGRRGGGPYGGLRCRLPFIWRGWWVVSGWRAIRESPLRCSCPVACFSVGAGAYPKDTCSGSRSYLAGRHWRPAARYPAVTIIKRYRWFMVVAAARYFYYIREADTAIFSVFIFQPSCFSIHSLYSQDLRLSRRLDFAL